MPKVFKEAGLRFHFYSFEGQPREPVHIHVAKQGADAKIWIGEVPTLARNNGLTARELRLALEICAQRRQEIEHAWFTHFSGSDEG